MEARRQLLFVVLRLAAVLAVVLLAVAPGAHPAAASGGTGTMAVSASVVAASGMGLTLDFNFNADGAPFDAGGYVEMRAPAFAGSGPGGRLGPVQLGNLLPVGNGPVLSEGATPGLVENPEAPQPTATFTSTPAPAPASAPARIPAPAATATETPAAAATGGRGSAIAPTTVPAASPTPLPANTLTPALAITTVPPPPAPTSPPAATPAPPAAAAVAASTAPEAVLVGAGDIANCGSPGAAATANLLDGIAGTVFTLGDDAYPVGAASDFASCYDPTWGRHKARTRPAPGNHEYYTSGAAPYFAYFGGAAGEPGKGYYSYNVGAWHIVSLNSNCSDIGGCGAGSPQMQWLLADLAASPAKCTLAIWHEPVFSSGGHGSSTKMQSIWQALYDAGADVVLGGHDHDYERFAPQDAAGNADPNRGMREFVVGTGGASHTPLGPRLANSQAGNGDTYGVLKLTLRSDGYDWQFVPEAGKTFTDSGSASCHYSPTPTNVTLVDFSARSGLGGVPWLAAVPVLGLVVSGGWLARRRSRRQGQDG